MKFTTNTKPLAEALNLGIIDSNISNFYKKSGITQISANENTLKINIESSMICTEIRVKGVGDGDPATAFVDSALFKKLIHTLESNVTLEFEPNGIKITSGKSKFTLSNTLGDIIDSTEFSLKAPITPPQDAQFSDINLENWKYIKDNQMYALAKSYVHPVYTKVWLGEDNGVLTGDIDASLFTYSMKGGFGKTCLLSGTIVNLLNSLPETAQITRVGSDYIIKFSKDAYDYVTQFTPQYEDDGEVGTYKSDMLLGMMSHPNKSCKVFTNLVTKLLNQASMLSSSGTKIIKFTVKDNVLYLDNEQVHGQIPVEGDESLNFSVNFNLDTLKQVISNYGDRFVDVGPMYSGDRAVGIILWNEELTTIFAGME